MHHRIHRTAILTIILQAALVLMVLATATAGATPAPPPGDYTMVPVWTWYGGGNSNDIRTSTETFKLTGPQQTLAAYATRGTSTLLSPVAGWTLEQEQGSGYGSFYVPSMGSTSKNLNLPAGTYRATCNSLNCTWTLTVYDAKPTVRVTSVTPSSGPIGTPVTITGTGFIGTTAVAFNSASSLFNVVSADTITTTVPRSATTGTISVTAPGGKVQSSTTFQVIPPSQIMGFAPTSGIPGTRVQVYGKGFLGTTMVTFGGVSGAFTVDSDVQITATVPYGAKSGPIAVTAPGTGASPGGALASTGSFAVTPPPVIASFSPAQGPVNSGVTLTGTGFASASKVTFNGISATFHLISSTQIVAVVPPGASSGPISVTGPTGTGTSAASFTVIVKPTITLGLEGLAHGAVHIGQSVTASGVVTPSSFAGRTVSLEAQRKQGSRWTDAKTGSATVDSSGSYAWKYKPAKQGSYRIRASIPGTDTIPGASTVWRTFKVR